MASHRRTATALATLVVYLAGLVGGGLHHHGAPCRPHAAGETLGQRVDHAGAWAAGCDDDEDGCAICAAIHQAKAPPLTAAAPTCSTPAADLVTAEPAQPPLPFRQTSRARGPPSV